MSFLIACSGIALAHMWSFFRANLGKIGRRGVIRRGFSMRVSDHALIRYLERVKGVDVEALRTLCKKGLSKKTQESDALLVAYIESQIGHLNAFRDEIRSFCAQGAGISRCTICVNGFAFLIQRDVVVTVMTKEMRRWRQGKKRS
ncbi:MAG: hypothetical protein WC026_16825 [Hyphomicrobium sp.]